MKPWSDFYTEELKICKDFYIKDKNDDIVEFERFSGLDIDDAIENYAYQTELPLDETYTLLVKEGEHGAIKEYTVLGENTIDWHISFNYPPTTKIS